MAEAGIVDAQFVVGTFYARGEGVALRLSEAAKWFERAAEQGHTAAQFNIGTFYFSGSGVRRFYWSVPAQTGYAA